MRRQLLPALRILLVTSVALGILYPLAVLAVGQLAFKSRADGSLITDHGKVVGSELLGQPFTTARYFHPRPSSAGTGYDATASAASNLGPTSDELLAEASARVAAYRAENGLAPDAKVPVEAVTSSGSGLDPHISVANARLQAPRVAKERNVQDADILRLIEANTDKRSLGFLGEPGVNILPLNLALDRTAG